MAWNAITTKLLAHFDGPPGSQIVSDESVGGTEKSIQVHGTLSDIEKKFGDASIRSTNVAGAVDFGQSIDWRMGLSVFTFDLWAYINVRPHLFVWYLDADNYFGVSHVSTAGADVEFALVWRSGGVDKISKVSASPSRQTLLGAWHHIAIWRSPSLGKLRIFFDGVSWFDDVISGRLDLHNHNLFIGRGVPYGHHGTLQGADGYFDEVRLSLDQELIDSGVLAGSIFPVRSAVYTGVREVDYTGRYGVLEPRTVDATGKYGLGLVRREVDATGHYLMRQAREVDKTGKFHVKRAGREVDFTGYYYLGGVSVPPDRRTYEVDATGRFRVVVAGREVDFTGTYTILDRQCEADFTGKYDVRQAREVDGTGKYNVLSDRIVDAIGTFSIESTADVIEVYHKLGSWPVVGVDSVWHTSAAYPFTATPVLTGTGLHYFIVVHRNRFDLRSHHADDQKFDQSVFIIELDATDTQLTLRPSAPTRVWQERVGGNIKVHATYDWASDPLAQRADRWNVYRTTNGVDPDPDTDTPVVFAMTRSTGIVHLQGLFSAGAGVTHKVIVRTLRNSDSRESLNTDVNSIVNNAVTPANVTPRVFVGAVNSRKELV